MGSFREFRWEQVRAEIRLQSAVWPESTYRSNPLGQEDVSYVTVDEPASAEKLVIAAARSSSRKNEDVETFAKANLQHHLKDRASALNDFAMSEEGVESRHQNELQSKPPGRLRVVGTRDGTSTCTSPTTASTHTEARQGAAVSALSPRESPELPDAFPARRERIHELQQSILDHDEERLAKLALGTFPLLGARNQSVLPVPPLGESLRMSLPQRLRFATANKIAKGSKRYELLESQVRANEASDVPLRHAATDALESVGSFDAVMPQGPGRIFPKPPYVLKRPCNTVQDILGKANELLTSNAAEDRWLPLAWRMTSAAYFAEPADVLHITRLLAQLARKKHGFTATTKTDLYQMANSTLHSLTHRLRDLSIELITEICETMGDMRVGSQSFLDSLLAQLRVLHHQDPEVLSERHSLRLCQALSRMQGVPKRLGKGGGRSGAERRDALGACGDTDHSTASTGRHPVPSPCSRPLLSGLGTRRTGAVDVSGLHRPAVLQNQEILAILQQRAERD
mmetsp:Transcript_38213/g.89686  ORF Transcript_38213/g.89686 Transcript_38213/m.89686 type:complete len:513 (+) Transcript_38213:66-1604(+)|eukprot:s2319_g8.t1